jgi:hypothetical protein
MLKWLPRLQGLLLTNKCQTAAADLLLCAEEQKPNPPESLGHPEDEQINFAFQ